MKIETSDTVPGETRETANADRRRLLVALAAGGFVSAQYLPERWVRPVVDSVLLPAHAQATCRGGVFAQTRAYRGPTGGGLPVPDQTFVFDLGGALPCGSGTVAVANLAGEGGGQWTIWLGPVGTGVNLGQTPNIVSCTPAIAGPTFNVSQAQLQAASSGGNIVVSADNNGSVMDSCNNGATMDVTLSFPT